MAVPATVGPGGGGAKRCEHQYGRAAPVLALAWRGAARAGRAACGGGEQLGRRRLTGEWPGGVVVQGGRGVEAAELGRRSGTAAEQEARWARRRRRGADQENAQVLEEGGG